MPKLRRPSILIFLGCVCVTVAISWSTFSKYARVEDVMRGALVILALALFQIGQVMISYEKEIEDLRDKVEGK